MQGSPARIAVDRRVIICVRIVSIRTDSGDRRHHKRLNFPKKLEKGTARDRDGGQRGRFVAHQYGSPLVRECSFRTAVGAESARGASRLLDRVGGLRAMALKLIKALWFVLAWLAINASLQRAVKLWYLRLSGTVGLGSISDRPTSWLRDRFKAAGVPLTRWLAHVQRGPHAF